MLDAAWQCFEEARRMDLLDGDTGEIVRVARSRYGME
jgi:hypothetical protein